MKIGIFDSGLGGLIVMSNLVATLPHYDYIYLGDTAHVPYGNRTQAEIYNFTEKAVQHLFDAGCQIIIIACNTASAEALRKIQQEYLPAHFPDRRVLGVLIPAAEVAVKQSSTQIIGVLATSSTVESGAFVREILKISPQADIIQQAAPDLVPLIESGNFDEAQQFLADYLAPFTENIDTLILGCTHYPILKRQIQEILGADIHVVSQDECMGEKLHSYLENHPELSEKLSKDSTHLFYVTELTETSVNLAQKLFNNPVPLQKITLE